MPCFFSVADLLTEVKQSINFQQKVSSLPISVQLLFYPQDANGALTPSLFSIPLQCSGKGGCLFFYAKPQTHIFESLLIYFIS